MLRHGKSRSCLQLNRIEEQEQQEQEQQQQPADDDLEVSHLFLNNKERLVLPRKGSMAKLDEYLSSIPHIVSRAGELMETDCSSLHDRQLDSSRRCLNVLQGEVAHVSAHQADVVVSAEATTCHVVALRSTKSASVPLVSLAHVDQVYDACLENMVKTHIDHHHHHHHASSNNNNNNKEEDEMVGFFMEEDDDDDEEEDANNSDQEVTTTTTTTSQTKTPSFLPGLSCDRRAASMPDLLHVIPTEEPIIEMELHMVGGYLDKEGTSQQLSTALINRFNDLAHKYQSKLRISLSTAAISCLNNNETDESNKPRSRGLGIDTRTGQVFPVKKALPPHLEGPALELRSARAFAAAQDDGDGDDDELSNNNNNNSCLSVIHDKMCADGEIRIQPFQYQQQEELNVLLTVSDDVLLMVTSTSPDQESDSFCTNFRRTLSFVNTVPPEAVFDFENNQPLVYTRSSDNLNDWEAAKQPQPSQSQSQQDAIMF
jgi:hypothetical protein